MWLSWVIGIYSRNTQYNESNVRFFVGSNRCRVALYCETTTVHSEVSVHLWLTGTHLSIGRPETSLSLSRRSVPHSRCFRFRPPGHSYSCVSVPLSAWCPCVFSLLCEWCACVLPPDLFPGLHCSEAVVFLRSDLFRDTWKLLSVRPDYILHIWLSIMLSSWFSIV